MEQQKYLSLVRKISNQTSIPPPQFYDSLILLRRATQYKLPSDNSKKIIMPVIFRNISIMKYLNQGNILGLSVWMKIYTLKDPQENFDLYGGLMYLQKIE